MFLELVRYILDCKDAKKPRSRSFMSGEFGGWLYMRMSSPVCATAIQKASSLGSMCVRALSYCIQIVLPTSSRGQEATMAGRSLQIR